MYRGVLFRLKWIFVLLYHKPEANKLSEQNPDNLVSTAVNRPSSGERLETECGLLLEQIGQMQLQIESGLMDMQLLKAANAAAELQIASLSETARAREAVLGAALMDFQPSLDTDKSQSRGE